MPSRQIAIQDMLTRFDSLWTTPYAAPNKKFDPPADGITTWARVHIQHTNEGEASLRDALGNQLFRSEGVLWIQVFSPLDTDYTASEGYVELAKVIFSKFTSTNGVKFRNVTGREVGPDGQGWYQYNITVNFQYEEIR